jgi:hypothetical protein
MDAALRFVTKQARQALSLLIFVALLFSYVSNANAQSPEKSGLSQSKATVDSANLGGVVPLEFPEIPFSAKWIAVEAGNPEVSRLIRTISLSIEERPSDSLWGLIPIQRLGLVESDGINYRMVDHEEIQTHTDFSSSTSIIQNDFVIEKSPLSEGSSKGCPYVDMPGSAAIGNGSYEIPGSCGGTAITISPSWISSGSAEWDYCIPNWSCISAITTLELDFYSYDGCSICVDPYVAVYNWSTGAWDYSWRLPRAQGWHYFSIPTSIGTYVSTGGCISYGVSNAAANETCVWWADLYYCYTEKNGIINASSTPSGATVSVNGVNKGTTPINISMPPGTYTVDFSKTCYTGCSKSVTVPCNGNVFASCNLTQQYGTVNFTSTPTGATVKEYGVTLGTTPFNKTDVLPGSHTYAFSKSCYTDCSQTISVACLANSSANCTLQPNLANVSFGSNPSQADVYEGSTYLGTTPFNLSGVTPVSHTYTFIKACYQNCTQSLNACGGNPSVSCNLTALATIVNFRSNPDGCQIYEGGTFLGTTPFSANVAPTSHCYTAKKQGYQDKQECISIACGQSPTLTFTLQPCYGTITGRVTAPNGTTPVVNVTIQASCSGQSSLSTTTDGQGYYTINNVPTACTPWTVVPSLGSDQFSPPSAQCSFSGCTETYTKNFVDNTQRTVSGTITYTTCNNAPAEGIPIFVNGQPSGQQTNQYGQYTVSVSMGPCTIQPNKAGHPIEPPSLTFDVGTQNITGKDFQDNAKWNLIGYCKTSCGGFVSGVTVTASSTVCNTQTTTDANGLYSFTLPPGNYTLCANKPNYVFECSPVIVLDANKLHDFVYKTHLKLVISTPDPLCKALPKGEEYTYHVCVLDHLDCPVTGATVTVTDEVELLDVGTPTPKPTTLAGGCFDYKTTGGRPRIGKFLKFEVFKSGYDNVNNESITKNLTVTGRRFDGTTFTTMMADQTPLMILYDPPGDLSYAYLEALVKYYCELGLKVEAQVGLEYEASVGVETPFVEAGLEGGGSLTVTGSIGSRLGYEIVNSARYETEHSSPDGNASVKGPGHGTVFLGAGLNMSYGVAKEVSVDQNCQASEIEVFGLDIATEQSGITKYLYTADHIENSILTNPALPDAEKQLWQQLLSLDISRDNQVTQDEYERLKLSGGVPSFESKTWCGGPGQGHTSIETVRKTLEFSLQIEIEAWIAEKFGFKVAGVGGGGKVKINTKLTLGSEAVVGHERSNTVFYWLEDNDLEDCFSTLVYRDDALGIPIFINQPGSRSMCPWEPFTSKNEGIDLINASGVWDTTICPGTNAIFNLALDFAGLLPGGSNFRVFAPPELNNCGATVTFNGSQGPLENINVSGTTNYQVVTRIIPVCNCNNGVNQVTIRAESSCDPQIYSEHVVIVRCDENLCPEKPRIVSPVDDAMLRGNVTINVLSKIGTYDGVKFYHLIEGGGLFEDCYDQQADPSGQQYLYTCPWNSSLYADGNYRLISVPIVSGTPEWSKSDTASVTVDNTCPAVVRTWPQQGAQYNNLIKAEFSELIKPTTVHCQTFKVRDSTAHSDVFCNTVTQSDRFAEFIPQSPSLDPLHNYEARILVQATDLTGNPLCQEKVWQFGGDLPGWCATIHAEGAVIGSAVHQSDVTLGVKTNEDTYPAPPDPIECTVSMKLWRQNWVGPYYRDCRVEDGSQCYSWIIDIDPNGNVPPFPSRCAVVSWNLSEFASEGSYSLWEDINADGIGDNIIVADMRTTSQTEICGAANRYFVMKWCKGVPVTYNLCTGWNLISLPVVPASDLVSDLFPTAIACFKFEAGRYEPVTRLETCRGYWLKVPSAVDVEVIGQRVDDCTSQRIAGWHLIGGPNCVVTPTTTPPGNLSALFGYNCSVYRPETQTQPGAGYWAKLAAPCQLILNCGSPSIFGKQTVELEAQGSRYMLRLVGEDLGGMNQSEVVIGYGGEAQSLPAPPSPPDYSVKLETYRSNWDGPYYQDLRLGGNRLDVWIIAVNPHGNIQPPAARTAILSWDATELDGDVYRLREGFDGTGQVVIEDMRRETQLAITGQDGDKYYTIEHLGTALGVIRDSGTLAATYELQQCYPNPFNPLTTIVYDLPKASHVSLSITDLLGREVRKLVDAYQQSGRREVLWDGRDKNDQEVASGVYFYRLTAGDFTDTKKMVLVK